MAREFYCAGGLNVETYDARSAGIEGTSVEGDVDFYVALAREGGGPVVELACGNGRVSFPIARAGIDVVGLDLSEGMLASAERRLAAEPIAVQSRVRFVRGDMAGFDLGERFPLVIIPFRAFQALLTPEAERACLQCIHRHLENGGLLVIDVFDPLLDLVVPGKPQSHWPLRTEMKTTHPISGNAVEVHVLDRLNDTVAQVLQETWRFTERDATGAIVRAEEERLRLRWLYRYEMRYLLELCGFEIEAEYSDFRRSPPAYGREQVWLARKR